MSVGIADDLQICISILKKDLRYFSLYITDNLRFPFSFMQSICDFVSFSQIICEFVSLFKLICDFFSLYITDDLRFRFSFMQTICNFVPFLQIICDFHLTLHINLRFCFTLSNNRRFNLIKNYPLFSHTQKVNRRFFFSLN